MLRHPVILCLSMTYSGCQQVTMVVQCLAFSLSRSKQERRAKRMTAACRGSQRQYCVITAG